jgi:hypothetical protein
MSPAYDEKKSKRFRDATDRCRPDPFFARAFDFSALRGGPTGVRSIPNAHERRKALIGRRKPRQARTMRTFPDQMSGGARLPGERDDAP